MNVNGEHWVLANIPHNYRQPCPLQDALISETPVLVTNMLNLYAGGAIKAFDMEKLVYFGVSIFWRGAAHRWGDAQGNAPPVVDLGVYQDPIRRFLLGGPFPDDVAMTVAIYQYTPALNTACPATPSHLAECRRYWFYVPCLGFRLWLGKSIPDEVRARCAYRSPEKIVCVDEEFSHAIRAYFTRLLTQSDQSRLAP